MKQQCTCGNWVEGRIVADFARKITRGAVKKGSSVAIGAAIGSVVPGLGTIVGGAIGLAAGALMEDHVKKVSDGLEDAIFNNDSAEYEFVCPKCGRIWRTSKAEEELKASLDDYIRDLEMNSQISEDGEDEDELSAEEEAFHKLFSMCAKNINGAIENLDEISDIYNDALADFKSDTVKSEYCFLMAWLYMERLWSNGFVDVEKEDFCLDTQNLKLGYDYAKKAKKLLGYSDKEYELLIKSYKLWIGDNWNNFDSGFRYILKDPTKGYAPQNNFLPRDYMIRLWYENVLNYFINQFRIFEDNETESEIWFKRIKQIVDTYDYVSEDVEHDLHPLWCLTAQKLAFRYLTGNGCDVNHVMAWHLVDKLVAVESIHGFYLKGFMLYKGTGCSEVDLPNAKQLLLKVLDLTKDNPEYIYNKKAKQGIKEIDELLAKVSTKDLIDLPNTKFSSAEQEYIDMLKDILEDDEVSARERKLLEKLRVKLGISEDRAKELEVSLSQPQLSEAEIEYLNEYRDIIADGEITPRERKLLDKICKMNGISPERAKELEAMA